MHAQPINLRGLTRNAGKVEVPVTRLVYREQPSMGSLLLVYRVCGDVVYCGRSIGHNCVMADGRPTCLATGWLMDDR